MDNDNLTNENNGNLNTDKGSPEQQNSNLPKALNILSVIATLILIPVAFYFFVLYGAPGIRESVTRKSTSVQPSGEAAGNAEYKKLMAKLSKDVQKLETKYNSYTSGQSYIVINTTENRFYLYKNKKLIRKGMCSSGSYTKLTTGKKNWVFKTPKGKYSVRGKTTNPVWKKPDWAFVEEGLPIPSPNDESRFEYGTLGDYALYLGDGYMIHGTIYKRFMGMPVTHGCVRLGDDDLEAVYNNLNVGSKVYLF